MITVFEDGLLDTVRNYVMNVILILNTLIGLDYLSRWVKIEINTEILCFDRYFLLGKFLPHVIYLGRK